MSVCDVMLTCKDELHSGQSDLAILGQVALHEMAHLYTRAEQAQNCTVRVLPNIQHTVHSGTYVHRSYTMVHVSANTHTHT